MNPTCSECDAPLSPPRKRFCSDRCRERYKGRVKYRRANPNAGRRGGTGRCTLCNHGPLPMTRNVCGECQTVQAREAMRRKRGTTPDRYGKRGPIPTGTAPPRTRWRTRDGIQTCGTCGIIFPAGEATYCGEPCRLKAFHRRTIAPYGKHARARRRLAIAARGTRSKGRIMVGPCRTCRTTVTSRGVFTYCSDPCRAAHKRTKAGSRRKPKNERQRKRRTIHPATRRRILNRDGWTCQICQQPIDPTLRHPHRDAGCLDHRIPYSRGGPDTDDNLQAAHWICNHLKSDRLPHENRHAA